VEGNALPRPVVYVDYMKKNVRENLDWKNIERDLRGVVGLGLKIKNKFIYKKFPLASDMQFITSGIFIYEKY
jgi:hypothetical protein